MGGQLKGLRGRLHSELMGFCSPVLQHAAEDTVLTIQTSADATILAQTGHLRASSDDLKTQKVILIKKKKML